MHFGPALAVCPWHSNIPKSPFAKPGSKYLGEFPGADTKPQDIKFFKIFEQGYDSEKGGDRKRRCCPMEHLLIRASGKWANEIASENGDSYTVQIPSDIRSGTYVLRTELIALHGNAAQLSRSPLAGPQFYTYCFNIEVTGGGTAQPEGVKFPGAYTRENFAAGIYLPFKGDSTETLAKGKELNSRYVRIIRLCPIQTSAN